MSPDGAVDADYDDAQLDYADRVAEALEDVRQEPMPGGIAIDIVTQQAMFVREKAADNCVEYYEDEDFDLVAYKMHPWLPGISLDNAVYTAVYLDGNPQNAHKPGKTYDFPSARLMHFPAEMAWDAYEVGDV
jgi:hypothetical protein